MPPSYAVCSNLGSMKLTLYSCQFVQYPWLLKQSADTVISCWMQSKSPLQSFLITSVNAHYLIWGLFQQDSLQHNSKNAAVLALWKDFHECKNVTVMSTRALAPGRVTLNDKTEEKGAILSAG